MKATSTSFLHLEKEEMARYARHLALPEIGIKGQEKLKNSSVICIGSGGLGSPILIYLAAAGVGRIGIVDNDLVDQSNLQRQVIHSTKSIGKSKVESAQNRVHEINPFCNVQIFNISLTNQNALEILKDFDVICDCTDNFESKYLINDACILLNKPNVYGAIAKFEGQATVFNLKNDSPNLRDLIPEPPPKELLPSCSEAGVIGVLPGIIGLIQATEVIKIITEIGSPLNGRVLIFNGLDMKFKELNLLKNHNINQVKGLIDYKEFCNPKERINAIKNNNGIVNISAKDLKDIMDNKKEDFIIIDVRNEFEYMAQSIKGAILIPLEDINHGQGVNKLKLLSLKKRIYIHCQTGARSIKAITLLREYGIKATNISGGIEAWNQLPN